MKKLVILIFLSVFNSSLNAQVYTEFNQNGYILITPSKIIGKSNFPTQSSNLSLGANALYNNTSGTQNTAIGTSTLTNSTVSNNTAIGNEALKVNSLGTENTAFGFSALSSNLSGNYNTAFGSEALKSNINGHRNTAFGTKALFSNVVGNDNIAFGYNALLNNIDGSRNIAIGKSALSTQVNNNSGTEIFTENIAIGNYSMSTMNGNNNVGIGDLSFNHFEGIEDPPNNNNILGYRNVGIGAYAFISNNSLPIVSFNDNVQIGHHNLENRYNSSENTSIGAEALNGSITGSKTAIGYRAMPLNFKGICDVAIGAFALSSQSFSINRVSSNTAVGFESLLSNNTTSNISDLSSYNTAVGAKSLRQNTEGSNNTALGESTLLNNQTGNYLTAIGQEAGILSTSTYSSTFVGKGADCSVNGLTNATAIGNGAIVNASNKVRLGNASVTVIEGQVAWTNPSDRRLKENILYTNRLGLDFISDLKPVSYNYVADKTKIRYDGFIAQDVEETMNQLKIPFSGLKKADDGTYSLTYSDFVMPLVNAVKELKAQNEVLKSANQQHQADYQAYLDRIEKLLAIVSKK